MALKGKQLLFVKEYLIDLNATQAALRAGYSKKTAFRIGAENLQKPAIQEAIQEAIADREKRTDITADKVLRRWWEIANVDVNDLVEYRRAPCPDCWAGAEEDPPPEINQHCPRCHGEGKGHVHIHDSRKLRGAARIAYNGAQVGKDGVKVLILDRDKALEMVARHLGMFKEKLELSGGITTEAVVHIFLPDNGRNDGGSTENNGGD